MATKDDSNYGCNLGNVFATAHLLYISCKVV